MTMSTRSPAAAHLAELETVIERGRQTFIEVGAALMEIRDQRLYRETHATFEGYCKERWGFTYRFANLQISAASVSGNLGSQTGIGYKQALALAPLSSEEQREVANALDFSAATEADVLREASRILRKRRQRAEQAMADGMTTPAPPTGKYRCLVIDPPWPIETITRVADPNHVNLPLPDDEHRTNRRPAYS